MVKVHRLGYASLVTPDIERQVDYWTHVIGLQIVDRSSDQVFLATKLGFEAIALERGATSHLNRISFQVSPDSDLGEFAAALDSKGVKNERRTNISPGIAEAQRLGLRLVRHFSRISLTRKGKVERQDWMLHEGAKGSRCDPHVAIWFDGRTRRLSVLGGKWSCEMNTAVRRKL